MPPPGPILEREKISLCVGGEVVGLGTDNLASDNSNRRTEPQPELHKVCGADRAVVVIIECRVAAAERRAELDEIRRGYGAVAADVAEETEQSWSRCGRPN